jgi:hypothetical protein
MIGPARWFLLRRKATGEGDHAKHGGGGEYARRHLHSPPPPPTAVPLPRYAGEEPEVPQ